MSIWERYSKEEREEYIKFLQVYGALKKLEALFPQTNLVIKQKKLFMVKK